jgi:hypothetical protein
MCQEICPSSDQVLNTAALNMRGSDLSDQDQPRGSLDSNASYDAPQTRDFTFSVVPYGFHAAQN